MKEQALLHFFVFPDFTVSPIFSCFTDFTARQIGYLYKSIFISPHFIFYSRYKANTNNLITNQGSGFTHGMIPKQNDFVFCLARVHTRAGMIPPFRQSAMNSEMITLRYRQVKVRKMARQKSEKLWIFSTFRKSSKLDYFTKTLLFPAI